MLESLELCDYQMHLQEVTLTLFYKRKVDVLIVGLGPSYLRVQFSDGESGDTYDAIPTSSGKFEILLQKGSYHVHVSSIHYTFPNLKLDIDGDLQIKAFYVSTEDSSVIPERAQYPLVLKPTGQNEYFTQAQSFDPLSMLKNPMVIMMLVFGFMMFVMPSLNATMQEQQREMQKQQQRQPPAAVANGKEKQS
jgi:hypothetical protein